MNLIIFHDRLKRSTQFLPRFIFSVTYSTLFTFVEYTIAFKRPRNKNIEGRKKHFVHTPPPRSHSRKLTIFFFHFEDFHSMVHNSKTKIRRTYMFMGHFSLTLVYRYSQVWGCIYKSLCTYSSKKSVLSLGGGKKVAQFSTVFFSDAGRYTDTHTDRERKIDR